MATDTKVKDNSKWKELDEKIEKGLQLTAVKLIAEQKKKNGFITAGDKKGGIKKIPASEL